ncbi:sigma-54 specific transcriptional regulator, flagellar regulatory protein A [Geoalkalibacter ferrihydriticus]|nr:sigma 54-interacting transcriptional regulator [Geoalkalibacter ferrihydriticus]SDM53944.1 sigma-54 specific transcriptional regulator, flagellar regulatory protein A [Geoalkalibacter ferrihydriticus]
MAMSAANSPSSHLPVPAPDLVVCSSANQWRIERISPALAQLLGTVHGPVEGRKLGVVFADCVPSLVDLAHEAASRGEPLEGVPVRLSRNGGSVALTAQIHPGGLTEDYRGQRVLFRFQPAAAQTAEAVQEFHGIVGGSPAIAEVVRKIGLYAASDASVVISGETGTGKELVARALHLESPRRQGPYVVMNCAAIAEDLLESELFGHEKGAFTGAVRTHRGRFERAHGGSLFLDELGDMPLHTQAKLLRVLEAGRLERVGGEHEQQVDVRVLCATNVPLERAVNEGRFRTDLYHRLAVLRIHLPPLRSRGEDIPQLVQHFLHLFNRKYGRVIHRLTPEALQILQSYVWPGNVRELRNVLERVYVETQAEVIGARAFGEWIRERQSFAPGGWDVEAGMERSRNQSPIFTPFQSQRLPRSLPAGGAGVFDAEIVASEGLGQSDRSTRPAQLDADKIRQAYQAADGNLAEAARLLGVHRATLYRYLRKLRLEREDLGSGETT